MIFNKEIKEAEEVKSTPKYAPTKYYLISKS